MRIRSSAIWALCFMASGASCGEKAPANPCAGDDPQCGVACSSAHPCAAGLYCAANQLCAKACDEANPCARGGVCSASGECEFGRGADGLAAGSGGGRGGSAGSSGPRRDAGPLDFGDNDGIMLPEAGMTFTPLNPDVCARSDVVAGRVTPQVILVIDQSSSMHDPLGGGTRWNVLRDFLLKDDGLIKSLQDRMKFGIAMYSARSADPADVCPLVTTVQPALDNYDAIAASYRGAEPIEDTPTGDSIDKIVASLPKPAPDAPRDPVILVLATDGEPDRCEQLDPQGPEAQAETIEAVTRAHAMHIQTFVIGVGAEISKAHQQAVANAGVGMPAGQNAPYWTADDDASLRTALMDIIGAQISCDIELKGRVEGDACAGTVSLSGQSLACKNADGWELVDPSHIRLLGKACDSFKREESSTLSVTFPCAAVVLE